MAYTWAMARTAKGNGSPSASDGPGFDECLGDLEGIVDRLERGDLQLEEAIEHYQRGIGLLKRCHQTLEGYRAQVEELTKDAEEVLRPFEDDPDGALGE